MKNKELNWNTWLTEGDQYLKAATPKREKSVFGPSILYNLLSMSMESYIMAMLDFHHTLPDNHTYTDLMDALERIMQVDQGLKTRILQYEGIQKICSVDKYLVREPSDYEVNDLRSAIMEISLMAHRTCNE